MRSRPRRSTVEPLEPRRLRSAVVSPLPTPWVDANIGAVAHTGTAGVDSSGDFVVSGSGADIWGSADAFDYAYQPLAVNGTVVARFGSESDTNGWAKAGVMLRTNLSTGSPFGFLLVSPSHGISFQARDTAGATPSTQSTTGPASPWLELVHSGSQVSAFYSADGVNWTADGSVTLPAAASLYAGLAVTAHDNAAVCTAVFSHVAVTAAAANPAGLTDADIGAVGKAGSASESGGVVSVSGSGTDIWSSTDIFNFDSESLVGDGTIVARLDSNSSTSSGSKAGIMLRETDADDSRYVDLVVTPIRTINFQYRSATHNASAFVATSGGGETWLKLTRSGSTFTGAYSYNGVSWTSLGSTSIPMVNNIRAGLCVCSHDNTELATARFDNLAVTPTGTAASIWSDAAEPPLARWEAQSVTYDDKLYIFGGFTDRSLDATADADVYNPAANTWSAIASVPTGPLTHAGTAIVGSTLYLAGGDLGTFTYGKTLTATADVLTYNFSTNSWGKIAPLPKAVSCGGFVAIGSVLYYYGGIDSADTADVSNTYAFNLADPSAGWVTKAPMPDARNHLGYAAVSGIAYAIGGQHLYDETGGNVADVDAYNPATNTWRTVASLPQTWSSFHVSTIVVNNKIAILGGQTNGGYDGIYQNKIDEFSPATNSWASVGTLPEANEGLAAADIDGELIAVGGTVDNLGGWATQQTWTTTDISL